MGNVTVKMAAFAYLAGDGNAAAQGDAKPLDDSQVEAGATETAVRSIAGGGMMGGFPITADARVDPWVISTGISFSF